MALGSRVRQHRLSLRWSQAELARRLNIKQQSIDQLESGKVKTPRYIVELAETLGVPLDWLRLGVGNARFPKTTQGKNNFGKALPSDTQNIQDENASKFKVHGTYFCLNGETYCFVPVYEARSLVDLGALKAESIEPVSHNIFRKDWVKSISNAEPPSNLVILSMAGDSMRDTLHDGDHVLVDLSVRRWVRDGMYVIRYSTNDELMIKRLVRQPSSNFLIVRSDNRNYGSEFTLSDNEIIIEGRVIWFSSVLG